jgi:broad specificity phosphatase PhoE
MQNGQQPPGEVFLIRHGETEWSLSGQHTGSSDIPLTVNGEAAARLLAPVLANRDFSLVLCSPLQRARRTCELAGLGGQASIDPDLAEWNYGSYEVGERVDRVISRVRQNGGRVALFAHGHVFRVFVARWIELSPSHGAHFLLDTSTLTILSYYRGIPAVKCWNAPLVASG